MNTQIFTTSNLSKKYKKHFVLHNVNMEIKRGSIYGFIGKNGAGKTTLIRILAGTSFPTQGQISLFGEKEEKFIHKQRKRIGAIIENPSLYHNMTAKDNLEVHRIMCGISDKSKIERVLKEVNLTDTGKKKVKHFSLGMKQRLGLAIALLNDPEFLILDEPINGLDPIGIFELREILKSMHKERGLTILISSHILSELYHIATCYGFIHKGNLLQQITMKELDEKCKKHIYLKVNDATKAISIIESHLHTNNYNVNINDNTIKLYDHVGNLQHVSSTLFTFGVLVNEITLKGDDLEGYFINLIGGKVGE